MEKYGARAHFMGPMLSAPGNSMAMSDFRGDGGMNKFRLSRTHSHMYLHHDAGEFAASMMNASMRVNWADAGRTQLDALCVTLALF